MAKPRDDRQKDLLRPALEDIIDLGHPLAREIDWGFLDSRFASVCTPGAGQPAADALGRRAVHPEDGVFGRLVPLLKVRCCASG